MHTNYKKIIQTYTHIKDNTNLFPPGFGDFISGTMFLYIESIKRNYILYVDYNNHIISNFLDNDNFLSSDPFDFFYAAGCGLPLEYILENYSTASVLSNLYPWEGMYFDDNLFNFIKNTFKPNSSLKASLEKIKNELNLNDYDVLHIRTGDRYLLKQAYDIPDSIVDSISEKVCLNDKNKKIFVAADCKSIKHKLKERYEDLIFIDNDPVHTGLKNNMSLENTKNTLIDYFIMSEAKNIHSFSDNGNSGWSLRCSQIYKIPLIKYKF